MAKETTKTKEFAIIQTGGKQYMVTGGLTLKIEKIKGPLGKDGYAAFNVGDKVVFNDVLLVDNGSDTTIGMPFIAGAKVTAKIIKIARESDRHKIQSKVQL